MPKVTDITKILEENQLNEIIKKCINQFPKGDRRVIKNAVRSYYATCKNYIREKDSKENIFNLSLRDRFKLLYEDEITKKLDRMKYITPVMIEEELIKKVAYNLLNYRSCQPIKEELCKILPFKLKD